MQIFIEKGLNRNIFFSIVMFFGSTTVIFRKDHLITFKIFQVYKDKHNAWKTKHIFLLQRNWVLQFKACQNLLRHIQRCVCNCVPHIDMNVRLELSLLIFFFCIGITYKGWLKSKRKKINVWKYLKSSEKFSK